MSRLFPAVLALCLLFVWAAYAMGMAVLAAYDANDPMGYLAIPRLGILGIAGVLAVGLLLRHMRQTPAQTPPLSSGRRWAEAAGLLVASLAAVQIWALAFAPAPYRLAEFQGATYALPISTGARVSAPSATTEAVEFRLCLPALTPYYDNPLCESRGITLTTQGLLDSDFVQRLLTAAGAKGAGDTIAVPGQLRPVPTGLAVTLDTRETVFATDASGRVLSFLSCDSQAPDLCLAGLVLADGRVALMDLPPEATALDEAARFQAILSGWRCPDAPGCVNKD